MLIVRNKPMANTLLRPCDGAAEPPKLHFLSLTPPPPVPGRTERWRRCVLLFIVPVESSVRGFPHLSEWLPRTNHVPPERERFSCKQEEHRVQNLQRGFYHLRWTQKALTDAHSVDPGGREGVRKPCHPDCEASLNAVFLVFLAQ